MDQVECFKPHVSGNSLILILGSMPGVASLQRQQYYAHPKNIFWEIMASFFGMGREIPYADRLQRLTDNGVGLWDVAARCQRSGSLDSSIRANTVIANDFQTLFDQYPQIRALFFNGKKAADMFHRLVLPDLPERHRLSIHLQTLPSTSPAHAAMASSEKIHHWQQILTPLNRRSDPA